ncbi:MAG: MASE1 domain-containing protein [Ignavibacteriaceae bacterium]
MNALKSGKIFRNKKIFLIVAIAIIYFFAGKFSLEFAFLNASASPFWLPTAISLLAFISFGYSIWPGIFLGAFFVNITTAGTAATSIGISAGNTLEGAAALYLINRFMDKKNLFDNPINIFKYALLAGIISTLISAVIGTSSLALGGFLKSENHLIILLTWWMGDMGSALIIAPVLFLWIHKSKINWTFEKIIEAILIFSLLIITSLIIFLPDFITVELPLIIDRYPYPLLTFPLILLITFRFGLRETATAIFLFYIIAVIGIFNGSERMASNDATLSYINLQIFTIIIFLLKMSVCAAINQRKTLEETLTVSEERYRTLAETASDAIISINEESKILFCNKSVEKIFGYKQDEMLGKNLVHLMPERFRNAHIEGIKRYIKTGKPNISWSAYELSGLHKNGVEIPLEISFSKFINDDGIIFTGIIRNITERKNAQIQMENSLKEKEILLKEIHHRVKNNLQIVSSLINLQSNYINNEKTQAILKESQNRIQSMALIHEKLYKSKAFVKINIKEYFGELIAYLYDSYNTNENEINLHLDIEDISLDIEKIISLGLIINELISNALKHGFTEKRADGKIIIKLKSKENSVNLEVINNGKEFPMNIDFKNTESLGLQLVNTLTEQLNGSLELLRNGGTTFVINFNK